MTKEITKDGRTFIIDYDIIDCYKYKITVYETTNNHIKFMGKAVTNDIESAFIAML